MGTKYFTAAAAGLGEPNLQVEGILGLDCKGFREHNLVILLPAWENLDCRQREFWDLTASWASGSTVQ